MPDVATLCSSSALCQQLLGELAFAMDVSETLVATLVKIGEFGVIQAEQPQDGGVDVMVDDGMLGWAETELIC